MWTFAGLSWNRATINRWLSREILDQKGIKADCTVVRGNQTRHAPLLLHLQYWNGYVVTWLSGLSKKWIHLSSDVVLIKVFHVMNSGRGLKRKSLLIYSHISRTKKIFSEIVENILFSLKLRNIDCFHGISKTSLIKYVSLETILQRIFLNQCHPMKFGLQS